jgi:adenylate kinase
MSRDEKHTNRVTIFLTDAQADFVNERTYALGMSERADFLRKLVIDDMRRILREFAEAANEKQRQLDASGHAHVGADLRGVGRNVIERDSEWPDTVQTR